jgi:tetratricopeptide (TPR) repeat protein
LNLGEIKRIEETFRNSKSSDELFDAFQDAIKLNISDIGVFKILLANPMLSPDEIKLFTEKLIKEMPDSSFELLIWAGKIFENHTDYFNNVIEALLYYERAISSRPESHEPLLNLLNLYNYEMNLPINQKIFDSIDKSISSVNRKSKIYYALAKHYKKCGNTKMEIKYLELAEKSAAKEKS